MTPLQMEFYKMSAGGNDFVLFDNRSGELSSETLTDFIRRVCTRALSVGADGVILLEKSPVADVRGRFFNPDGQPTFCGNGARCVARLAYLKGIAPARMTIQSDLMVHRAEVRGLSVSIEMRDPRGLDGGVEVQVAGERIRGTWVDTGVPHFVLFRDVSPEESIDSVGRALRSHPRFSPAGTNVDFVRPLEGGILGIRSFERGVEGETLACGTGCVAAAVAAAAAGKVRSPVALRTRSGDTIRVRFEGDPNQPTGVQLEGGARLVFVGHLTEESTQGFRPAH
jgi:diaminopimelate epimerase